MTCSEFVEGFSDYHDGTASAVGIREAEDHLSSCAGCRRYRDVLVRGAEVLRALPTPGVREDFVPRLQHRLYHVDQKEALHRQSTSGSPGVAVFGVAVLFAAAAWSPTLHRGVPVVELAPIVVSHRPVPRARPVTFSALSARRPTSRGEAAELWTDAHLVLFEYSRLAQRYGHGSALRQAGLQQEDG